MRTDQLVAALRTAADEPGFGAERAATVLERAAVDGTVWLDARYQQIPDGEDSALYPLYRDPGRRWSVVAAVFRPGVPTTVHDHGAWAAIVVCRGVERETWLRRTGDGPLEQVRRFDSAAGSVRVLPDGTIHSVEAIGEEDAVSVHVYGTDIVTQERSAFDVATGAERPYSAAVTADE